MKRGASGDGSPVGDQELVLPYPALNIRFGVSFVIVSFVSVVLGMLAAVCLWLSILCVNQLLVLAGWGWDDFFVDPSASWLPVAGVGLVVLPGTLMVAWLVVLSAVHCLRKARRARWLRLSSSGFEVNDRLFKPRRYHWHEIGKFMLVAPSPHIEDAVVAPAKTFAEAFRDGGTQYPVFRVGFHCSPGHRRTLANRIFRRISGMCGQDGTRADGLVTGYWDRPFDEAVDLMNEWLTRYKDGPRNPGAASELRDTRTAMDRDYRAEFRGLPRCARRHSAMTRRSAQA